LYSVFDGQRMPTVRDILELREAIRRTDARLVIVDPLFAYLPAGQNTHVDADIRQVLGPISQLADETGCTFLCIRHLNKTDGTKALYRGGGSIGLTAAARVVLLVAEDPGDPDQRVLCVVKSNLAAIPPSLAYRMEAINREAPRIRWEGASTHRANDLLSVNDEQPGALEEAEEFLHEELGNGPVRSTVLFERAAAEDIAKRTLQRAKRRLGIRAVKTSGDGPWMWELPDQDPQA